jgi:hypothetical protein
MSGYLIRNLGPIVVHDDDVPSPNVHLVMERQRHGVTRACF